MSFKSTIKVPEKADSTGRLSAHCLLSSIPPSKVIFAAIEGCRDSDMESLFDRILTNG